MRHDIFTLPPWDQRMRMDFVGKFLRQKRNNIGICYQPIWHTKPFYRGKNDSKNQYNYHCAAWDALFLFLVKMIK